MLSALRGHVGCFEVVLWRRGCYSALKSKTLSVLLQYYSVLQSTTPVLLCTTKYYSLLQSTTPVLLCTTKYYSSTTPVLQSTTPVLLRYYKVLLQYCSSATLYYKVLLQYYSVLQSTTPVPHPYCACLILVTYETSFTMRGASKVNLEPHQLLRLPSKMNLMLDPCHIWNVIYNARNNRSLPLPSPNTAPATQNEWIASVL